WLEWDEGAAIGSAKDLSSSSIRQPYQDGERLVIAPPEATSWNETPASMFPSAADLNAKYQQLVTDFPDYVSSELLGEDDFGNEIWEFHFAPPAFRWIA